MIDFNSNSIVVSSLEGSELSKEELRVFSEKKPAGFILFSRSIVVNTDSSDNIDCNIKTRNLIRNLQSLSNEVPFFIGVDQEGGRVSRIKSGVINLGACLNIAEGRSDSESLERIYSYGKNLSKDLSSIGFNFDFAPVLDIYTPNISEAVGDRCWGRDPESVYKRAYAFLKGVEEEKNLIGCLKHFPGLGRATIDTHLSKTYIDVKLEELKEWEFYPYKKIIENYHPKAIMISHGIYPSIDVKPASLSSIFIQDLLKKELGFDSVVVSDDTLMKGFCDSEDIKDWKDCIVESVVAGVDLILVCKGIDRYLYAIEALNEQATKSPAFRKKLEYSQNKIINLRKSLSFN